MLFIILLTRLKKHEINYKIKEYFGIDGDVTKLCIMRCV